MTAGQDDAVDVKHLLVADLTALEVVVNRRQVLKKQIADAEEELKTLDSQIKEAWGDAPEATIGDQPVGTWKWSDRQVLDQTLLKATHPQAYQACKTTQRTRSLRITWEPPEQITVTGHDRNVNLGPEDDF